MCFTGQAERMNYLIRINHTLLEDRRWGSPCEHEMADPPARAPASNIFIMNCVFKALAKGQVNVCSLGVPRTSPHQIVCGALELVALSVPQTFKINLFATLSWVKKKTKQNMHTVLFTEKCSPYVFLFRQANSYTARCDRRIPLASWQRVSV